MFLHSKIAKYPNFNALRFDYTFTDKTTSELITSYVNIAFNDTSMFLIFFGSKSNDFSETSKSFENLMNTFYIIGLDEISNNSNTNINTNTNTSSNTSVTTSNKDNQTTGSSPCETKNKGVLTIVNKSLNPYIIYKNGNYLMTIKGKEIAQNILVDLGATTFKAEQQSGFAVYPTVNKRLVNFTNPCEEQTINIGFADR